MPPCHCRTTAALVTISILAACSKSAREPAPPTPRPAVARHPYTEADVHFMTEMISHHAQAIVMASWAPTHNAAPPVRRLAERIVNGQLDEIATAERWLRDRNLPVPQRDSTGATMPMSHTEHRMLMPGRLTEVEMRQLDQANRAEFDRLFLTFMIRHHRGALSMVEALFGSTGAARDETVFKFANDINVDQTTEIQRMQRLLAGLGLATPNQ